MIEPGARAAAKASRSGKIGVIGTEATIASGAYTRAIQTVRPRAEIYTRACPLLVPLVEEGFLDNEIAEKTVAYYLESLKASGIDTLLLGCTHYPLLRPLFQRVMGPGVKIIDSATATAESGARAPRCVGHRLAQPRAGARVFSSPKCPTDLCASDAAFSGPRSNPQSE